LGQRAGDQINRRISLYVGAVLGGTFWGLVWLLRQQSADRMGAEQGLWKDRPTWWDDRHLAMLFGHLWIVVAGAWLLAVLVGGAMLLWGRARVLRSMGVALIMGTSAGWLIVIWMLLQHVLLGWVFARGI
jgi:hypothetical protein